MSLLEQSFLSTDYATGEMRESLNDSNISFSHHRRENQEDLTPLCNRISSVLSELGYSTVKFVPTDVDSESNSISVFVLESWAETILNSVLELSDRLITQKNVVKDAVMMKRMGEVSKESLQTKIKELQSMLLESEKREKTLESKLSVLELSQQSKSSTVSADETSTKKIMKNLELQIQESERRVRQKEQEMDKLREKLRSVADKEKETAIRNRQIFTQFKQGDLSFVSESGRSPSSLTTPLKSAAKASAAHTPRSKTPSKTPNSVHSNAHINTNSVLEALEEQRAELFLRTKEQELQVRDLTVALRDAQNKLAAGLKARTSTRNSHQRVSDSLQTNDSFSGEDDTAGSIRSEEELTPVARQMYDKILQQQGVIEQLLRQAEVARTRQEEADTNVTHLRAKSAQMREQYENLRLELETRPSVKQWTATQREMRELEDKLGDLTVMRGDSAEIAMWRKHLSTHDRIKIDKRNHELGMWLLDSLPKTVMKEVLQSVCRELDITDISDIHQCVVKLKAVVKTVPRMERFISQVCSFVFERDPALQQHNGIRQGEFKTGSSLEDVFPMLKGWWQTLQRSFELQTFTENVLRELHRREQLISHTSGVNRHKPTAQELQDHWQGVGRLQWAQRDPGQSVQILRDLVDFEQEVMHNKQSLLHAAEFVRDQPAVIVNRIVSHVQYLFEIKSLEGVLPRMNQVYLFTEEMRNFLATSRAILGAAGVSNGNNAAVPNAVLLAEIERRLSLSCSN